MRHSLVLVAALAACTAGGHGRPVTIAVGEVPCDYCHMVITSERHAAELVPATGAARTFDEPGCLLRFVAGRPDVADERLWVRDEATGEWIDARRAFYVVPDRPPAGMMYGMLAWADAGAAAAARPDGRVSSFEGVIAELRQARPTPDLARQPESGR